MPWKALSSPLSCQGQGGAEIFFFEGGEGKREELVRKALGSV